MGRDASLSWISKGRCANNIVMAPALANDAFSWVAAFARLGNKAMTPERFA